MKGEDEEKWSGVSFDCSVEFVWSGDVCGGEVGQGRPVRRDGRGCARPGPPIPRFRLGLKGTSPYVHGWFVEAVGL